jgi:bacteriocin-like protein
MNKECELTEAELEQVVGGDTVLQHEAGMPIFLITAFSSAAAVRRSR